MDLVLKLTLLQASVILTDILHVTEPVTAAGVKVTLEAVAEGENVPPHVADH